MQLLWFLNWFYITWVIINYWEKFSKHSANDVVRLYKAHTWVFINLNLGKTMDWYQNISFISTAFFKDRHRELLISLSHLFSNQTSYFQQDSCVYIILWEMIKIQTCDFLSTPVKCIEKSVKKTVWALERKFVYNSFFEDEDYSASLVCNYIFAGLRWYPSVYHNKVVMLTVMVR